jgi:hypothetical protein
MPTDEKYSSLNKSRYGVCGVTTEPFVYFCAASQYRMDAIANASNKARGNPDGSSNTNSAGDSDSSSNSTSSRGLGPNDRVTESQKCVEVIEAAYAKTQPVCGTQPIHMLFRNSNIFSNQQGNEVEEQAKDSRQSPFIKAIVDVTMNRIAAEAKPVLMEVIEAVKTVTNTSHQVQLDRYVKGPLQELVGLLDLNWVDGDFGKYFSGAFLDIETAGKWKAEYKRETESMGLEIDPEYQLTKYIGEMTVLYALAARNKKKRESEIEIMAGEHYLFYMTPNTHDES